MSEKSFESSLSELEEIVKQLEDGQLPLEQALDLFAEGIQLANLCNRKLEIAEQRIKVFTENSENNGDACLGGG